MEIFHVLNRGVDKRNVVADDTDRLRFMQGLYLYNDKNLLDKNTKRLTTKPELYIERELLVKIHLFCLMDNHYHLLLSPIDDEVTNISSFMRKLNMGYAKYFNEKYDRSGALWQGKYKKIHIEHDTHFFYIAYYIHLNPLDKPFPEWRDGTVNDLNGTLKFLKEYKWSSYQDYNGIKNYPSLLYTSYFKDILGSTQKQTKEITSIITDTFLSTNSNMLE